MPSQLLFLIDLDQTGSSITPRSIGGPGIVVEIDESVVAKRKYNRGHLVPERWVFGGYCPTSAEGFIVMVEQRNAGTLLPLIQEHIRPGSIIHSDGWAAYGGIANMPVVPQYTHLVVNHTVNFVDPGTGACTNHVENMWKRCNAKVQGNAASILPCWIATWMSSCGAKRMGSLEVKQWRTCFSILPSGTPRTMKKENFS